MGAATTATSTTGAVTEHCANLLRTLLDNGNALSVGRLYDLVGLSEKVGDHCTSKLCGEGIVKRDQGRIIVTNIGRALTLASPEQPPRAPAPKTRGIMDAPKATPPLATRAKFFIPPSVKPKVIAKPPSRWGQRKPFVYDWASIPVGQAIVVPIPAGFEFAAVKKLLTADSSRFAKVHNTHFTVRTVDDEAGNPAVGVWRDPIAPVAVAAGKAATKK